MNVYLKTPWIYVCIVIVLMGLVIYLDFSEGLNNMSFPYQEEFFACVIALVSVCALYHLHTDNPFLDYLFICIPYSIVIAKFLFSPYLPVHDSWMYHFPVFKYIGDSLSQGNFFPAWIPSDGGVRIGFFHINLILILPHRILGYFLSSIFPISDILAYKLQYILGVMFIGFGWWLFLQKLTCSRYAAYLGTIAIMMGGTGITFHQEQVLATSHLLPWFALFLWKLQDDSSYIFPIAVLFGLGLATHYPQIQIISMGMLIFFMLILRPAVIKHIYKQQKRCILLIGIFIIFACLPSLYLFYNIETLESSHRAIYPETYEAYLDINKSGFNSALPEYFYQYLTPIFMWFSDVSDPPIRGFAVDYCAFFVGRIVLVLALIGVFIRLPKTIPIVFLLFIFTGLTLGINSVIPFTKFFYFLHFPFISIFRQWIHFFPMINFCLSALAAIGLAGLERLFHHMSQKIVGIIILLILFLQIVDVAIYDRRYLSVFHANTLPARLTDQFFSRIDSKPTNLFQYKNRYILHHFCPEAIPTVSFLTTDIISVIGSINSEIEATCRNFFQGGKSTITNIPSTMVQKFLSGEHYTDIPCHDCVQPDGLVFDITTPKPALFVTPLNYDINAKVYIDGKETSIWRVNGALSGVLVDRGEHRIEFKIPHDVYILTVLVQLALYMFLIVFFVRKRAKIIKQKGQ